MYDEQEQRAKIVAEARSWLGTPYHNCGDVKGAGVDCGMILVRVFADAGLIKPFDPRPYPIDWHLHRDAERYLEIVTRFCREVPSPGIGDIIVYRYGHCYSHGAIVTGVEPFTVVHALMRVGKVIEEEEATNSELADSRREPRFFSLWAGRPE